MIIHIVLKNHKIYYTWCRLSKLLYCLKCCTMNVQKRILLLNFHIRISELIGQMKTAQNEEGKQ